MVVKAARVREGQKVFVHGLSGAVGRALLTLAKMQGAQIFGTASPKNHPALIELGATPFDYSNKGWIATMRSAGGVDAVFDPLGFESFDESYSILRRGGVLVAYGLNLPALSGTAPQPVFPAVIKLLAKNLAFWSGKKTIFYGISRNSKTFLSDLKTLFDLLKTGRLSVPIKAWQTFGSDQSSLPVGKHPGRPIASGRRAPGWVQSSSRFRSNHFPEMITNYRLALRFVLPFRSRKDP
jgi:NADPH:quinone reductase-like Zn-dependent oxidoreductase